jgi:drug/metabolite transporter (DMT)-like permease
MVPHAQDRIARTRQNGRVERSNPAGPSAISVAAALGSVYIVWGSTYLAIAIMVETLPPLVAAGVRYASAGVILLIGLVVWARLRGEPFERPTRLHWRSAIVVGTLLLLGGNGGVVLGEQRIASGIAALIVATSPIWMAVFESLVARERPSGLAMAGLGAGTIGVGMLVAPVQGPEAIDPIGIALVAGAAISWSIGAVYAKRAPLPSSPFTGAGLQMLAGGAVMLAVGVLRGELADVDPAAFSTASLLAVAYLIIFGSLVAFTAYIWLLNHVPITVVSTSAYVNPVVAVALGAVVLSEPMTPRTWLAAIVIIGAVVAMVTGRPRTATEPEPCVEPEPEVVERSRPAT